jgi:hypothetical protein
MELGNIMLSKINQIQKEKYHTFSHMWNPDLKPSKQKDINIQRGLICSLKCPSGEHEG